MNVQTILTVLLFVITWCTIAWAAPVTTYVAEFSMSGASKPDEMKSTIQTLLLSRLSNEKITTTGKQEGAEIKVSGSYILSGSLFSLDALAVNASGGVVARSFAQGKDPDELIPAVAALAKSLAEGIEKGTVSSVPSKAAVVQAEVVRPMPTVPAALQGIYRLEGVLSGIAVGRTFPGGERELFVIGTHTLRYYRQGAEMKLLTEIPYKVYENVLAVDTADLDNDSIPEIYVTVMKGETLVSQVWTVDGVSMKQIAGPLPYFFRALSALNGKKKLYAQKISGLSDFDGQVAELVKSGESYTLTNPVKLPKQGYLYNFNLLKSAKGEPDTIITDRSGNLRVFNPAGDELLKSSEEYGGSETSFKRTDLDSTNSSGSGYRKVFLDQRTVVKADGELLVPKNSGSWYTLNKHTYNKNSLFCFAWNGTSLDEKWHTSQSGFYLSDFAYDDAAHEVLLLEVVSKEDGIFDAGASRIVIKKVD